MVSPFGPPESQHTFGNGNRLESPIPCLLSAGSLGLDRMTNFFSLMAGCTLLLTSVQVLEVENIILPHS